MLDDFKGFLVVIGACSYLIIGSSATILLALATPFPQKPFVAFVPWIPLVVLKLRDALRYARLGFAHDRVREISLERQENAEDWLVQEYDRERAKTKPLP